MYILGLRERKFEKQTRLQKTDSVLAEGCGNTGDLKRQGLRQDKAIERYKERKM